VAVLPAFYTYIASPHYGTFAVSIYHDRSECQHRQTILGDGTEVLGKGGRRLCTQCREFAPEDEADTMRGSWRDAPSMKAILSSL
jgi:hypothetical protein